MTLADIVRLGAPAPLAVVQTTTSPNKQSEANHGVKVREPGALVPARPQSVTEAGVHTLSELLASQAQ